MFFSDIKFGLIRIMYFQNMFERIFRSKTITHLISVHGSTAGNSWSSFWRQVNQVQSSTIQFLTQAG